MRWARRRRGCWRRHRPAEAGTPNRAGGCNTFGVGAEVGDLQKDFSTAAFACDASASQGSRREQRGAEPSIRYRCLCLLLFNSALRRVSLRAFSAVSAPPREPFLPLNFPFPDSTGRTGLPPRRPKSFRLRWQLPPSPKLWWTGRRTGCRAGRMGGRRLPSCPVILRLHHVHPVNPVQTPAPTSSLPGASGVP